MNGVFSLLAPRMGIMLSNHFSYKGGFFLKKVCSEVSLCENFQCQSCKAFTGLSNCTYGWWGQPFKRKFCF